ncbi:unnamed protein product [Rangifer tarandus platyrhynchus]|uniref:Uncharacterized protein n=1 Tax=Rangifer tarandus platyrhynchus TaxID=3082113 RepID=A0ABN8YCK0_RANTA|nr:unnamed protein product [Rangifer tarandus platyrhynchus]
MVAITLFSDLKGCGHGASFPLSYHGNLERRHVDPSLDVSGSRHLCGNSTEVTLCQSPDQASRGSARFLSLEPSPYPENKPSLPALFSPPLADAQGSPEDLLALFLGSASEVDVQVAVYVCPAQARAPRAPGLSGPGDWKAEKENLEEGWPKRPPAPNLSGKLVRREGPGPRRGRGGRSCIQPLWLPSQRSSPPPPLPPV